MPNVGTTLKDWSPTSSSNIPAGTTAINQNLDDDLREIQGVVARGLSSKGADIASAATADLGAVEGLSHDITGTTTITSFGTVRSGIWKILKFEGALTLTNNANIILPGGANITTANGDVGIFISEGAGVWRCVSYTKAGGWPISETFTQAGTNVTTRTQEAKLRDIVTTPDYTSVANAWGNVTTRGSIIVPRGAAVTPAGATGKDISYLFIDGGDADNIMLFDGTRGGLYADYDCKGQFLLTAHFDEDQSAVSGGGFRDALFVDARTNDGTDYTAIGNKVVHAGRFFTQGPHNGTAYTAVYQDLVGAYFSAAGNVQWSARGTSAITADAWQFGTGIASNEFAINNPDIANGGISQSISGAAVQAIVRFRFADEDSTHFARGVYVENNGLRITAGIEVASNTSGGWSGHFKHALYMASATTTGSAIVMPQSASGDVGTIIAYDANDYSYFDRANNRFNWINGGALVFSATPNGLSIGSATTTGTWLFIEPSTTAKSHLRLFQGVAPSSPSDGDIWYDGTALKIHIGATTRTFTVT